MVIISSYSGNTEETLSGFELALKTKAKKVVITSGGKIEKLQWQVPEAPRFFEAMVRGRNYQDIQIIASRICGICSITHSFAAIKAIESAMGLKVSEQTDKIRILMHYSEQLQSHTLHIGYLAAPDFFGVPSVVPLIAVSELCQGLYYVGTIGIMLMRRPIVRSPHAAA
jgi:coenzyme F420-reducing hydrogenase alpha subunit